MSVLSRKPKPNPVVYVATQTAAGEHAGQEILVVEGVTRIRAGHALLKAMPTLFKVDESGGPLVEPQYSPSYVEPVDPTIRLTPPVPPEDIVVAVRSFIAGQGPGGMLVVMPGDRFDRHHATVKRFPDNFRPQESAD